ncbi:hypothetical protein B0T19DRAFT_482846 [Cercophora scortea]|uniref:DUF6594 domain-containing protein n=1 Tax=Cercophora scortea TaxID=314031 RepID=A0AAE0IX77_9PEZI|nr:hypothetical protein B0T19DRAFT_482846 [Cercophora scortea]
MSAPGLTQAPGLLGLRPERLPAADVENALGSVQPPVSSSDPTSDDRDGAVRNTNMTTDNYLLLSELSQASRAPMISDISDQELRIYLENQDVKLIKEGLDMRYKDVNEEHESQRDQTRKYCESPMHEYTVALQDWEYMKKCQLQGQSDPFLVTSTRMIDHDIIKELLGDMVGESPMAARNMASLSEAKIDRKLFGGSRTLTNKRTSLKGFLQRLSMAILGGAFLIAPMHLMVFRPDRVSTLATSSAFVLAFGVVMSFYLDKPFDVLSGTAAYAAVLVVFVGASGT